MYIATGWQSSGPVLRLVAPLLALLVALGCDDAATSGPGDDAPLLDTGHDDPAAPLDQGTDGEPGEADADGADGTNPDTAPDTPGDVFPDGPNDVTPDTPSDASLDPFPDALDTGDVFDADTSEAVLTIVVEGSLEDRAPDDGLSAQTPLPYFFGLQRLEMLRTADDPDPHVIFDHDPDFVMVDMHDKTVVARVPVAELPNDTFDYFRIVLTLLEAEVDATLHSVPVVDTLPTRLRIVYALSDIHTSDLDMEQGDATVSTTVVSEPFSTDIHWDVTYPEPAPTAWAESIDSRTHVTFLLSPPLDVSPESTDDLTYAIRYYIHDSFRWQDQPGTDYAEKEWDIDVGPPASAEPVVRFGANAYEVVAD